MNLINISMYDSQAYKKMTVVKRAKTTGAPEDKTVIKAALENRGFVEQNDDSPGSPEKSESGTSQLQLPLHLPSFLCRSQTVDSTFSLLH